MSLTKDEVTAIVNAAIKPVTDQLEKFTAFETETKAALSKVNESVSALEITAPKPGDKPAEKPGDKKPGDDKAAEAATAGSLTADAVNKLIQDALTKQGETAAQTAAKQQATRDFLLKHAPKLKDNPVALQLVGAAADDAGRTAAIENVKGLITATGVKQVDFGSSPGKEGAEKTPEESAEAQRAAALEAADKLTATRL